MAIFVLSGTIRAESPGRSIPLEEASLTIGENSPQKPNIVLILVDDLGWHQVGVYGSEFYETPNIDRLAVQGMRFTDAYVAGPVCSPARASIMTGKYPARLHLTDFIRGRDPRFTKLETPDWTPYLALRELTIAELLKASGYVTGHFGKWHLNEDNRYQPGRPMDPGSQGFDEVLATEMRNEPRSAAEPDWHRTHQITDRARGFIEENRNRPFFCYVSYNSIHRPEMEKESLIEKYRAKPGADNDEEYGHNNPVQAAMLETVDQGVGAISRTLDHLGLSENTIVVFFSDNGHLGPKDSTPLRGSKADLYEGGIRVPLIVRWPAVVASGGVCPEPVISNDFLPTFAEVAGSSETGIESDGISLLPLLTKRGVVDRDALYWHYPHYHPQGVAPSGAVRMGNYKLIEWFEKSLDGIGTIGALELYDLADDPGERNDLTGQMPGKASELYENLNAWRQAVGAQLMAANRDYDSSKTRFKDRSYVDGPRLPSIATGQGLAGLTFNDSEFSRPDDLDILSSFENDWGDDRGNDWSARWIGLIEAPETGAVTFFAEVNDGIRLSLADTLVIDGLESDGPRSGTTVLEKGKMTPVVLEYTSVRGKAKLRLFWAWAGKVKSVVPGGSVRHDPAILDEIWKEVIPPSEESPETLARQYAGSREDLHIYLLIGQSNMAGRAAIRDQDTGVMEGCYLLDREDRWLPASNPLNRYSTVLGDTSNERLNPGYMFAQTMRQHEPGISIGLICNAKGATSIEEWMPGTRYYDAAVKRAKAVSSTGVLKGVLWHQGEGNHTDSQYLEKLVSLIRKMREDLGDENLIFVAGGICEDDTSPGGELINSQLARLPAEIPMTGFARSEGLNSFDGRWHFGPDDMNRLGQRYANAVIRLGEPGAR